MIGIIDYGLGNLFAISRVFEDYQIPYKFCKRSECLETVSKIILPGVGTFDYAMELLNRSGMRESIEKRGKNGSLKIMGICVGFQIMCESSEEGNQKGLGFFNEKIIRFESQNAPIPHMGWNTVKYPDILAKNLFKGINQESEFYFLHSYFLKLKMNLDNKTCIGETSYIEKFSSLMIKDNFYGIQFHPEKSHENGEKMLINFAKHC